MNTAMAAERAAGAPAGQRAPGAGRRATVDLLDPRLLWRAMPDAVRKLNPASLYRNPVMFIVEVGAVFTTVLAARSPACSGG